MFQYKDLKTISSMQNDEFFKYAEEFLDYAKTLNPESCNAAEFDLAESHLPLINEEIARRRSSISQHPSTTQNRKKAKKKKRQKKGTLRIVFGALYCLSGLFYFGTQTYYMVLYMTIGFALLLWGFSARKAYKNKKMIFGGKSTSRKSIIVKQRVKGVSFKNEDGKSRQTLLRRLRYKDEPFEDGATLELKKYEYGGEPAIGVFANGYQLGSIAKEAVPALLEKWESIDRISGYDVIGGGTTEDGEKRHFGLEIYIVINQE